VVVVDHWNSPTKNDYSHVCKLVVASQLPFPSQPFRPSCSNTIAAFLNGGCFLMTKKEKTDCVNKCRIQQQQQQQQEKIRTPAVVVH
jgi:hypothetical protein